MHILLRDFFDVGPLYLKGPAIGVGCEKQNHSNPDMMTRKTLLLTILWLFASLSMSAQRIKERRVYYLDCSYSMKTNGLWEPVRDNLKLAIDNVEDETTELIVIPFAFDMVHHSQLDAFKANATTAGKKQLKENIDALQLTKNTKTFHNDPIKDFYSNHRVDPRRINYMFLMTDGENEDTTGEFTRLLKQWGEKYGEENVYGFYVMLDPQAKNPEVEGIIDSQPHLWKVESADVNVNLVRLQNHAIFNARNEKYFDLPLYGNLKGMKISASFPADAPIQVSKAQVVGNHLRIQVRNATDVHKMPPSALHEMKVTMSGGGPFDFLVTDKVKVKCESKPERSLKVTMR